MRDEGRPQLVATLAALFALGAWVGLVGAFLVPAKTLGVYGVALVVAIVGNVALCVGGGLGTGRLAGAVAPALGWLLVAVFAGSGGPGSDRIIPGSLPTAPGVATVGQLFLLLGVLAAAGAVLFTQRRLLSRRH